MLLALPPATTDADATAASPEQLLMFPKFWPLVMELLYNLDKFIWVIMVLFVVALPQDPIRGAVAAEEGVDDAAPIPSGVPAPPIREAAIKCVPPPPLVPPSAGACDDDVVEFDEEFESFDDE